MATACKRLTTKARDSDRDSIRLHGHDTEVHANRTLPLKLNHAVAQRLTHRNDVAAGDRGNTQANTQFAVKAQDGVLRVNVSPLNGRDIAQKNLSPALAANDQLFELLDSRESAR